MSEINWDEEVECEYCKYAATDMDEYPCNQCKYSYTSCWAPMSLYDKIIGMSSYEMAEYFKEMLKSDLSTAQIEQVLLEPLNQERGNIQVS